jgi:hypothetical protein
MREPLTNPEPLSRRAVCGRGTLVTGAALVAVGLFEIAAWIGLVPVAASPRWAIGTTGLIAVLVGWILVRHARACLHEARRLRLGRQRHPGQPWRYDHPWDPTGARERPGPEPFDVALEVALYLSFALPFNLWAFEAGWSMPGVPITAILFDLAFAALSVRTVRAAQGRVRNGRCRLEFASFPFRLGGSARFRFVPARPIDARFVLHCIEEAGGESFELFREETEAACDESGAALEFELPDRQGLTTRFDLDGPVRYWRLEVSADLRAASFLLPVYAQAGMSTAPDAQQAAATKRWAG